MTRVAPVLPQGEAKVRAVRTMFDTIAPRYDLVNRIMTFGLDIRWRRKTVRSLVLPTGSVVLDVACGTGDLCAELERAGHSAIGLDLSLGMLGHGRGHSPLVQGDALVVPLRTGSIDGATCGFALRNVVDLAVAFAELARVVRPGGRIALLEVAVPANRVMRAGHTIYFGRVVPVIGGLLSDKAAYRYLPQSVAYLPPPPALLRSLEEAGFTAVRRTLLTGGIAQLIEGTRL